MLGNYLHFHVILPTLCDPGINNPIVMMRKLNHREVKFINHTNVFSNLQNRDSKAGLFDFKDYCPCPKLSHYKKHNENKH